MYGKNEAKRFCFALTLWPSAKVKVKENGIKTVEDNGTYKHGRYDKMWSTHLRAMLNLKVFVMQDSRLAVWPAGRTRLIPPFHMLLILTKREEEK